MRARTLRVWLIGALVVAAVVTVVANKTGSPFVGWLGLVIFLGALALYARWRHAALAERRARVFDREAKTDEAGARTDK
jgi:hypothetical protein